MATAAEGTKGSEMNCSMNGYNIMVEEIVSLSLVAITMIVQTFSAILPNDLKRSLRL